MELLSGVKNIVFDLGGVLLNIDPKKTIDAFGRLGMEQLVGEKGLTYDHDIFYRMEQGLITPDEFRTGVLDLLPQPVSFAEIDAAWTAMLLDIPAIRVQLLKNLRKNFRIYLFSNTNAIHVDKFHDDFRKLHGFEMSALFDKDFYSNELGYRKPSPESFLEVFRLAGIDPAESLFIDDAHANIEAAKKLGMKTHWLEPGQKVESLFQEYL
jgi:putative hydrolase of the HAD superfamily